jgi:hypothetical protein
MPNIKRINKIKLPNTLTELIKTGKRSSKATTKFEYFFSKNILSIFEFNDMYMADYTYNLNNLHKRVWT